MTNSRLTKLHSRMTGKTTETHGNRLLTGSEEDSMVKRLKILGYVGMPFTLVDVRAIAYDILQQRNSKDAVQPPGDSWARKFIERHTIEIGHGVVRKVKKSRAEISLDPTMLREYHENLCETLKA